MAEVILKVEGTDGQLELMADRVIIKRAGLWSKFAHGFGGDKEIPISSITTVEFKNATVLGQGEINFAYSGMRLGDKPDQNKVKFNKKEKEKFIAFKEKVFEMINSNQHQKHG